MYRCWVALILLVIATLASAQNLQDSDYSLTVDVELVVVPVSVLDSKGFPVRGLSREHFNVYEDKVLQDISLFKQEDIPLSIGLVIDSSSSMAKKLDRLNVAAMTFVQESNPDDETAIVSFGDESYIEQDFTGNTNKLRQALSSVNAMGDTALYDAVYLAAKHLQKGGSHEKKVLLVISDGEDNKSSYKLKEVLRVLRESKIILYSIGLLSDYEMYSYYGYYGADSPKKALKQLADVTGGASFFPKSIDEVEGICQKIARDLRNQYTIGYKPTNTKMDGSWRKVSIRLNAPKPYSKLKVRTKQGYYAPVPRPVKAGGRAMTDSTETPRNPRPVSQ
jgi:Ca-activated chloride channel homolog